MSHDVSQQRENTGSVSPTRPDSSEGDDSCEESAGTDLILSDKSMTHPETAKFIMDRFRDTHLSIEGRFISGTSVGYIFSNKAKLWSKPELDRLGVDMQHNKNDDYFHIKRISSLDDRRNDQIHQLVDLGVIHSTSDINNIDDWIWKVAGINKALSDRLLKM